jgi:DNA-directed RNA polymerase subunit L
MYVTSQNFVIYDRSTDKPIANQEKQAKRLFPPDAISGGYIPICCLRPRITDADDVEEIEMVIDFSIGKSKEDACWNMVSKCCFENKKDDDRFALILKKDAKACQDHFKNRVDYETYMQSDMSPEERRDFEIIESQRVFIPNHYIMYIESLGVFTNEYLVSYACEYILKRLEEFNGFLESAKIVNTLIKGDEYCIYRDKTTVKTVYVLYVKNDDYTIGKILEKYLYYMYGKELYYVSFKKEHPHDSYSLISFSYKNDEIEQNIITHLNDVSAKLSSIYKYIQGEFRK